MLSPEASNAFEVTDKAVYKIYRSGQVSILYYKIDPDPETLAYLDVANASRLSPKEGQTILERLIEKSDSMLPRGSKLAEINNLLREGKCKEEEIEAALKREGNRNARSALDNIIRVLGHNNILEQGHVLIAIVAPISAVMNIQDERFVSTQERSTRYVSFDEMYVPESIKGNAEALSIYSEAVKELDNAMSKALEAMSKRLTEAYIREHQKEPEEQYIKDVIKPSARDLCRGLVPMGKQTVVFLSINAKSLESITKKMLSSNDPVNRLVGEGLKQVAKENVPSFASRIDPDDFELAYHAGVKGIELSNAMPEINDFESEKVELHGEEEAKLVEKIGLMALKRPEEVLDYVRNITGLRHGKYDALNNTVLGIGSLLFDIEVSVGTLRDLQRHRDAIKNYQVTDGIFYFPRELMEDPIFEVVERAIKKNVEARKRLSEMGFGAEAKLLLPLAAGARLEMEMSFGEAVYIIENRSTPEGHPEYRQIALRMWEELKKAYPNLVSNLKAFVPERTSAYASREERQGVEEVNKEHLY